MCMLQNFKKQVNSNCKLLKILFVLLCSVLISACGGSSSGTQNTPSQSTGAAWTFMVYMDADNDLDPYSSSDLAEMMSVGSNQKINIIVQYDGYQKPAYRYKVDKGVLTKIAELNEPDMANPETLRQFISSTVKSYPAEKYALILWNHGNGWKSSSPKSTASILVDWDNNGKNSSSLANSLVAKAIADSGVMIDLLGVDACIMATVEAAYEFRNIARYLVASQELVSVNGWNYKDILSKLSLNPDITPENLAILSVESYKALAESLSLPNQTMSAIKLSEIQAVASAADSMVKSIKPKMTDLTVVAAIEKARTEVQEFDPYIDANTYIDLADFAKKLEGPSSAVASAIKNAVIANYSGKERPAANGLSIAFFNLPKIYESSMFLKMSLYDKDYINLSASRLSAVSFLDATSWGALLDSYYSAKYSDIYSKMQSWSVRQAL